MHADMYKVTAYQLCFRCMSVNAYIRVMPSHAQSIVGGKYLVRSQAVDSPSQAGVVQGQRVVASTLCRVEGYAVVTDEVDSQLTLAWTVVRHHCGQKGCHAAECCQHCDGVCSRPASSMQHFACGNRSDSVGKLLVGAVPRNALHAIGVLPSAD